MVVSMKYTLGLVLFPFIIFLCLYPREGLSKTIMKLLTFMAVFTLGFALFHLPLINGAMLSGYIDLLKFLSCYGQFPIEGTFYTIKIIFSSIFLLTGSSFSIPITVLTALGAFLLLRREKETRLARAGQFVMLLLAMLMLSIIFERKGLSYYYTRYFVSVSILAAIGLSFALRALPNYWNKSMLSKAAVIGAFAMVCIFGPIIPFSRNAVHALDFFVSKEKYYDGVSPKTDSVPRYRSFVEITRAINDHKTPGMTVVPLSIETKPILFLGNFECGSSFAHSYIYRGGCPNPEYEAKASRELALTDWIVACHNDNLVFMTGEDGSTWSSLRRSEMLSRAIDSNFVLYKDYDGYYLFMNRKNVGHN
jgi:hypothetical protein